MLYKPEILSFMTGKTPISSLNQNAFNKDPSHALSVLAILRNDRNARWDMLQIFLSKVNSREAHWAQGKNMGLEVHSSGFKCSSITVWAYDPFFISKKIIITALKVYKMFKHIWSLAYKCPLTTNCDYHVNKYNNSPSSCTTWTWVS